MCDHFSITPSTFCIGDWHIEVQILKLTKCERTEHDDCSHAKAMSITESLPEANHHGNDEEQDVEVRESPMTSLRSEHDAESATSSVTLTDETLGRRLAEKHHDGEHKEQDLGRLGVNCKGGVNEPEAGKYTCPSSYSSDIFNQLSGESRNHNYEEEQYDDHEEEYESAHEAGHEEVMLPEGMHEAETTTATTSEAGVPVATELQSRRENLKRMSDGDGCYSHTQSGSCKRRRGIGKEGGVGSNNSQQGRAGGFHVNEHHIDEHHFEEGHDETLHNDVLSEPEWATEDVQQVEQSEVNESSGDESSDDEEEEEDIPATPKKVIYACPLCKTSAHWLVKCEKYQKSSEKVKAEILLSWR